MDQFRPIGLSNFSYKVISETLSNKMKPLMDRVISLNQSIFLSKRKLADNVVLAHEVIHYIKKNKKKAWVAAIKFSKAYDRLEWSFLAKVMIKLGFDQKWVNLILNCLNTGSYSIILYGSPMSNFKPE